jgi:hypothetical protein
MASNAFDLGIMPNTLGAQSTAAGLPPPTPACKKHESKAAPGFYYQVMFPGNRVASLDLRPNDASAANAPSSTSSERRHHRLRLEKGEEGGIL